VAAWIVAGMIKPQLMVVPCVVLLGLRRCGGELGVAGGCFLAVSATVTTFGAGDRGAGSIFLGRAAGSTVSNSAAYGIDPLIMYNVKGVLTALLGRRQGRTWST